MTDPPKRSLGEFAVRVPAGSLGFTDDLVEDKCDLHELLVRDSSTTYVYTVCGDSMDRAGILDGDKVLVDRGLEARDGDIVVAVLFGDGHTLKRLQVSQNRATLIPESNNPRHRPRQLRPDEEWLAWGVVTAVIRKVRSHPTATTTKKVRSWA
jgi:DNA polymerase V